MHLSTSIVVLGFVLAVALAGKDDKKAAADAEKAKADKAAAAKKAAEERQAAAAAAIVAHHVAFGKLSDAAKTYAIAIKEQTVRADIGRGLIVNANKAFAGIAKSAPESVRQEYADFLAALIPKAPKNEDGKAKGARERNEKLAALGAEARALVDNVGTAYYGLSKGAIAEYKAFIDPPAKKA